ncbi:MFS transporter [Nakamurella endophytica]|uniref:Major facilitator superfamily (MFS) profile domain-containing protein n=1 Tax=Nakamurella endophytica TaxID=1748367 RepID=A0A917SQ58_9ACTN|nr:MFS transporter [Nakamurella endophytica]GGL90108.1 hypothetical protein GCM10011594_07240 [Nakamurella endophytica]
MSRESDTADPSAARPGSRHSLLVTYLFTAVMVSTTLPTPLYAIYSARLSLSPLTVTVIYAVYAVGVLGTLQVFGRLSDHVGRRAVVLAAIAFSALSGLVFVTTDSLVWLFVGRFVSGISAGRSPARRPPTSGSWRPRAGSAAGALSSMTAVGAVEP